ncbi:SpoIIE family protein phosphatase [Streptomyces sp. NBC_01262]|uniref:SpoIIE family protein phosphatase n=1 Tax=Streptomyces sp. NBC_01262 TaxID=2903803 RepID=UPI002E335D2C|nr:SpoIIE family protein phosphatase [Streptomyces sp. NBC_01262]
METYGPSPPDRDGDRSSGPLLALVTTDLRGAVTGWTPGAERLLGHTVADAVGRPVTELLDLPDLPSADGPDGREERHAVLPVRHKDGRLLVLPVSRCPLASDDRVSGSVLVIGPPPDPTAGREGEALSGWLLADSPIALSVYDTDLRHVWQSAEMRSISGMSGEARRGLRLTDILAGPEAVEWEERMRRVLTTGEEQVGDLRVRLPGDARPRVSSLSATPLRDAQGQMLGVCVTATDVTEARRSRDRLALLNDAGIRIGSTLDVTRTGRELTEVAVPRLSDFARVDLLEVLLRGDEPAPGPLVGAVRLRRIAELNVFEGVPEVLSAATDADVYLASSPAALCLATGRTALYRTTDPVISSWLAEDPVRQGKVERLGTHSWLLVPVTARGTTLGVVMFVRNRSTPEPFDPEDISLAEDLVGRAAVCLDNARRFTRERTAALALQRSLLPQRLPEQSAVQVASRYLPATPRAGVGGDWYDVIGLSGARVGLVVGDVVGHGIHAAAAMGRLRTAVRTLADVDPTPDELLTRLDDLVIQLSEESGTDDEAGGDPGGEAAADIGATCLYAVYDPVTGRCSLARAGHPPPVLVTPDGTAEFLELPAGPPLGLGGLPFESVEVPLPEGSLLALYTDGLVESRHHDLDVGLETLRRALITPADSLETLCDHAVKTLLPDGPTDDAALLLVRPRILDPGRVAMWDVSADGAAVAQVRAESTRRLDAWGLGEAGFVTELVVSELVTNAIRYGGSPIQLRLIHDRALICEVSDASSTAPHMRRARVFDEGGRGLLLVAQLTQRWGTRQTKAGKTIWCEQALPTAATPSWPG